MGSMHFGVTASDHIRSVQNTEYRKDNDNEFDKDIENEKYSSLSTSSNAEMKSRTREFNNCM